MQRAKQGALRSVPRLGLLFKKPEVRNVSEFQQYLRDHYLNLRPESMELLSKEYTNAIRNINIGYVHGSAKFSRALSGMTKDHHIDVTIAFFSLFLEHANSQHWSLLLRDLLKLKNVKLYESEEFGQLIQYIMSNIPIDGYLSSQLIAALSYRKDYNTMIRLYEQYRYLDLSSALIIQKALNTHHDMTVRRYAGRVALDFANQYKLQAHSLQEFMSSMVPWGYLAGMWCALQRINDSQSVKDVRTIAFGLDTCATSMQVHSAVSLLQIISSQYASTLPVRCYASIISMFRRSNIPQLAYIWSCFAKQNNVSDDTNVHSISVIPTQAYTENTPICRVFMEGNGGGRAKLQRFFSEKVLDPFTRPLFLGITNNTNVFEGNKDAMYTMKPNYFTKEEQKKDAFFSALPEPSKVITSMQSQQSGKGKEASVVLFSTLLREYLQPFVNLTGYSLVQKESKLHTSLLDGVIPANRPEDNMAEEQHMQCLADLQHWESQSKESVENLTSMNITKAVLLGSLQERAEKVPASVSRNIRARYFQPLLELCVMDEKDPSPQRWQYYSTALVQSLCDKTVNVQEEKQLSMLGMADLSVFKGIIKEESISLTHGEYLARQQFLVLIRDYMAQQHRGNNVYIQLNILHRFIAGLAHCGNFNNVTWCRSILKCLNISHTRVDLEWIRSYLIQCRSMRMDVDIANEQDIWVHRTKSQAEALKTMQSDLYSMYSEARSKISHNIFISRLLSKGLCTFGDIDGALFWIAITSSEEQLESSNTDTSNNDTSNDTSNNDTSNNDTNLIIPAEPQSILNPYLLLQHFITNPYNNVKYPEPVVMKMGDSQGAPSIAEIFRDTKLDNSAVQQEVQSLQAVPGVCSSETTQRHYTALLEGTIVSGMVRESFDLFKLVQSSLENSILSNIYGKQIHEHSTSNNHQNVDFDVEDTMALKRVQYNEIWSEFIYACNVWRQNPVIAEQHKDLFVWVDAQIRAIVDTWNISHLNRNTALYKLSTQGLSNTCSNLAKEQVITNPTKLVYPEEPPNHWTHPVTYASQLRVESKELLDSMPNYHDTFGIPVHMQPQSKQYTAILEYFTHDKHAITQVVAAKKHFDMCYTPNYSVLKAFHEEELTKLANYAELPSFSHEEGGFVVRPKMTQLQQYICEVAQRGCQVLQELDPSTDANYSQLLTHALHLSSGNQEVIETHMNTQIALVEANKRVSFPKEACDVYDVLGGTGQEHAAVLQALGATDDAQVQKLLQTLSYDRQMRPVTQVVATTHDANQALLNPMTSFPAKVQLLKILRDTTTKALTQYNKPEASANMYPKLPRPVSVLRQSEQAELEQFAQQFLTKN